MKKEIKFATDCENEYGSSGCKYTQKEFLAKMGPAAFIDVTFQKLSEDEDFQYEEGVTAGMICEGFIRAIEEVSETVIKREDVYPFYDIVKYHFSCCELGL